MRAARCKPAGVVQAPAGLRRAARLDPLPRLLQDRRRDRTPTAATGPARTTPPPPRHPPPGAAPWTGPPTPDRPPIPSSRAGRGRDRRTCTAAQFPQPKRRSPPLTLAGRLFRAAHSHRRNPLAGPTLRQRRRLPADQENPRPGLACHYHEIHCQGRSRVIVTEPAAFLSCHGIPPAAKDLGGYSGGSLSNLAAVRPPASPVVFGSGWYNAGAGPTPTSTPGLVNNRSNDEQSSCGALRPGRGKERCFVQLMSDKVKPVNQNRRLGGVRRRRPHDAGRGGSLREDPAGR